MLWPDYGINPTYLTTYTYTSGTDTVLSENTELEMPGFTKESINVTVKDGCLKVETSNYKRNFSKTFLIGSDVDPDSIGVTYLNGVLVIEVKKVDKSRKLEVK